MENDNDLLIVFNKYFPIDQEIKIVEENDEMLVINKPVGVVVNDAVSARGMTVQAWMEERYDFGSGPEVAPEKYKDWDGVNYLAFWERDGMVHRLDKETSGLLVLAKNPDKFVELLKIFREREVRKTYYALVHGVPVNLEGEIDAPVGRLPWNRVRFGVFPGGRQALTSYKVINIWKKVAIEGVAGRYDFALVEVKPHTGRTHQIRVHMQLLGTPIVGDELYSGRKLLRAGRKLWKRMCLVAGKLEMEGKIWEMV